MSARWPVEGVTVTVPVIDVYHHPRATGTRTDESMPEAVTAICRLRFHFGDGLVSSKSVRAKTTFRTPTGWPWPNPASRAEVAAAVTSTARAAAVMVCRHGISVRHFAARHVRRDGTSSPTWLVQLTDADILLATGGRS